MLNLHTKHYLKMKLFRWFNLSKISLLLSLVLGIAPVVTAADQSASVAVKTTAVVQTGIGNTITTYGVLEPDPDQVVSLSLPHGGLVNRVWVRLGQRVKQGDKLMEVVTSPESRMQFLQAQSAVEFADGQYQRTQRMFKEQLATRSDLQTAKKTLQDAKSTLRALTQRGQGRTEETLKAPEDGIITRLDLAQGQRVPADTTALLIAAERFLIARTGLEPDEISAVTDGLPVTISSVFDSSVSIESHIRAIHAMVNPDTHLVDLLIPIPENKVDHLVLGSRIAAEIHLPKHLALVVPRSAVLQDAAGYYLFIAKDGKAVRVPVKIGVETIDSTEVSGALNAGDSVIISGNYELSDGAAIREMN